MKKKGFKLKMKFGSPSYTKYSKENEKVAGINYDAVNEDRVQVGNQPLSNKTVYK